MTDHTISRRAALLGAGFHAALTIGELRIRREESAINRHKRVRE